MASEGKYLCLSMESSSDSPFPVAVWGWMRPQGKWATQRGSMLGLDGKGRAWVAPVQVQVHALSFVISGDCHSGISGSLGLGACRLALCPHLISSFHEDAFGPGFGLFLFLRRLWLIWPSFSLGRPKGNQTFTGMFWSYWPTSAPVPPPLQRQDPMEAQLIFRLVGELTGYC